MAKPTSIFHWATTGTRTAPSSGKQDSGWAFGEQIMSSNLNWLVGIAGDWITWLQAYCPDTSAGSLWSGGHSYSAVVPFTFTLGATQGIRKTNAGNLYIENQGTTITIFPSATARVVDMGVSRVTGLAEPVLPSDADTYGARLAATARVWPSPSLSSSEYAIGTSEAMITNQSITVTPKGNNPVMITLGPAQGYNAALEVTAADTNQCGVTFRLIRTQPSGSVEYTHTVSNQVAAGAKWGPAPMFTWIDSPPPGVSTTYQVMAARWNASAARILNVSLRVVELPGQTQV